MSGLTDSHHLGADGLFHDLLFLILVIITTGILGLLFLDQGEGLQPRHAGHMFIKKNYVKVPRLT